MSTIKLESIPIKSASRQQISLSNHTDTSSQEQFEKLMQSKKEVMQSQAQTDGSQIAQPLPWLPSSLGYQENDQVVSSGSSEKTVALPINLTSIQPMLLPKLAPLSQTDPIQTLYLRITQGPLAGIVLQANIDKKSIALRLATPEYQNHTQVETQQALLHALFGQGLDHTLSLENTNGKYHDE